MAVVENANLKAGQKIDLNDVKFIKLRNTSMCGNSIFKIKYDYDYDECKLAISPINRVL